MKNKKRMKGILKIVLGVLLLLALLFLGFRFFSRPGSYAEVFDQQLENMTPGENSSSFAYFNVQEYKDSQYYINDSSQLCSNKNGKVEVISRDVENFLLSEDELVYSLIDHEKEVYSVNLQGKGKRTVAKVNAQILLADKDYFYLYSEENRLYKYDKKWTKIEETDMREKGYKGCFERACVMNDKIVFYTEESEVYLYDMKGRILQKIGVPDKGKVDYTKDADIIQWDGKIYYSLCYYDDGDLHNSWTHIDLPENGIYRLDIENGKFTKVSNDVGDIMLVIDNELCVVSDHFLGISYEVRKVDFLGK